MPGPCPSQYCRVPGPVRVSAHQLTRTSENPSGKLRSELSVRLSRGGTVRFVKATQYFLVLPWLWCGPICTVGETYWGGVAGVGFFILGCCLGNKDYVDGEGNIYSKGVILSRKGHQQKTFFYIKKKKLFSTDFYQISKSEQKDNCIALHPMAQTNRQTHTHTDGHGDSMTESAQWGLINEN